MSRIGAAPRAAVPVNNARAAASRRNGAKSRGPKTAEGKARAARNALKHGLRAQKHVVLPDEDAAEFRALETALLDELAPEGALQVVLARRVAVAASRLARADRMETEVFAERRWDHRGVGVALIRDGNGTRSFETLLRYRGAAMAEFWRALRTLKALQAEAATELPVAAPAPVQARRSAARPADAHLRAPNEPERLKEYVLPGPPAGCALHEPAAPAPRPGPNVPERLPDQRAQRCLGYALPDSPAPGRTLHEPAAPWLPNEPESDARGRDGGQQERPHKRGWLIHCGMVTGHVQRS
jgi:hypothetical protein